MAEHTLEWTEEVDLDQEANDGQREGPAPRTHAHNAVLKEAEPGTRSAQAITTLAASRTFTSAETAIEDLADAMDGDPELLAVGVVDEAGAPIGLVLRAELFAQLGRPYGREFYKKKPVSTLAQEARVFRDDLNIFSVADMLARELREPHSSFYLLADTAGRYSGVFSTRNLLVHLSDITARDIALARRIQTSIVQESWDTVGGRLRVACASTTAKEVGGDFYLVKKLDETRHLVAVCDVSGKGIAASLITAVLGGFFDGYGATTVMKDFLARLNRYIHDTFRLEFFVTGIIATFDEQTGEAVLCNLGHSYLLLMEGGTLFRLGQGKANPPLGVSPDLAPLSRGFHLKPGALIVIFTDGVVEQTNARGEEYSPRRLWARLKTSGHLAPREISQSLSEDLAAFRTNEPQKDDMTWVVLRFT